MRSLFVVEKKMVEGSTGLQAAATPPLATPPASDAHPAAALRVPLHLCGAATASHSRPRPLASTVPRDAGSARPRRSTRCRGHQRHLTR